MSHIFPTSKSKEKASTKSSKKSEKKKKSKKSDNEEPGIIKGTDSRMQNILRRAGVTKKNLENPVDRALINFFINITCVDGFDNVLIGEPASEKGSKQLSPPPQTEEPESLSVNHLHLKYINLTVVYFLEK
jgi:hypothetical protein